MHSPGICTEATEHENFLLRFICLLHYALNQEDFMYEDR